MPELGAVILARDEAARIGALVTTLRRAVHEVLVVDTGSEDETVARATAAGARVLRHAWDGDYAAARNHALEAAREDWVLFVDADEVPANETTLASTLKPLIAASGPLAWTVEVRRFTNDARLRGWRSGSATERKRHEVAGYVPVRPIRLVRRHPDLRFEQAFDETLAPALARMGAETGATDLVLHDLGALIEGRRPPLPPARWKEAIRAALEAHPNDPVLLRRLARHERLTGSALRAEAALVQAKRSHPGDAEVAADLGELHLLHGRLPHALSEFKRASDLAPDEPWFAAMQALAALGLSRPRVAVGLARSAVRNDPGLAEAWRVLAVSCLYIGDLPEAVEAARRAMALHGRAAPYHLTAGMVLEATGRTKMAARAYRRAAEIDPRGTRGLLASAQLLTRIGRLAEARKDAEEALRRAPADPEVQATLARVLEASRNPTAAGEVLARTVERNPEVAGPRFLYARVLARNGDPLRAAEEARAGLLIQPNDPLGLLVLATAYLRLQRPTAALRKLEKVLEVQPEDREALRLAGAIHAGLGNCAQARDFWNRFLRAAPTHPAAPKVRQALERLAG